LSPASRGKFHETPDTAVWTGLTGLKILTELKILTGVSGVSGVSGQKETQETVRRVEPPLYEVERGLGVST